MSEDKNQMSKDTKRMFHALHLENFDIQIFSYDYASVTSWNYSNVIFNMWVLYWNPMYGGELMINGKTVVLEPRQVFLIPPYTVFSTKCTSPFLHFYIHFTVPPPFDRVKREILKLPADHIKMLLPRFQTEQSDTSMMLLFRILIYEYLYRIPEESFLNPGESVMDTRIRKVIGIMSRESTVAHDNRKLAKRIGMSLNNFYHLFQAETGTTPKQYLLNLKMENARQLLIHTDASIDEITLRTGFSDRYHFSKAFKSFFSLPPVLYRNSFPQKEKMTLPPPPPATF